MFTTHAHNLKRNILKEKMIYKKENEIFKKCSFVVEPIQKKEKKDDEKDQREASG